MKLLMILKHKMIPLDKTRIVTDKPKGCINMKDV